MVGGEVAGQDSRMWLRLEWQRTRGEEGHVWKTVLRQGGAEAANQTVSSWAACGHPFLPGGPAISVILL